VTKRSRHSAARAAAAASLATALLVITGCAPARYTEGVTYEAERQDVRDAAATAVQGHGELRFDAPLRADLDDALAANDLATMRQAGTEVLRSAHALADRTAQGELERMPPEGLQWLANHYRMSSATAGPDALRAALKEHFAQASQKALAKDLAAVDAAPDRAALHKVLVDIRKRIAPAAGDAGRLGRVLLTAPLYVPATLGAEMADKGATERSTTAQFDHTRVYSPGTTPPPTPAELQDADVATLARIYAPVFVQEINPQADYPARDDRIGRVYLTGSPTDITVKIDDADPVVYWAHATARVRDQRYDQLIYVAWYPARPALSAGDPQAGRIDGVVIRVTLDSQRRPAVYEFVRTCGCYHTLWVAEFVEKAAEAEYHAPLPNMAYAVQRPTDNRHELFMPAIVPDDGTHVTEPVVTVNAGQHLVLTVDTAENTDPGASADERVTYRLEPYSDLTHLPLGDGVASMFGSDGLVHGAARAEGWLLAPTGMLQAGRPRQLGTMKIRMDAYDYDDPRLLERNLRLPSGF